MSHLPGISLQLTLILMCGACTQGHAQGLFNHTAIWKQRDVNCFGGSCSYYNYTITLGQDTVVNGRTYLLPMRSGIVTEYNLITQMVENEYPVIQTLAPMREEDGILYRYHHQTDLETAFHDFNMSVGDTAISNCSAPQVVELIDTIYIGTIPRRRYFFAGNDVNYLIEGIGTSDGLLSRPCNGIFIESSYSLLCFQLNGEFVQIDTAADCSDLTTAVSMVPEEEVFEIGPNPFHDRIRITTREPLSPVSISIFDPAGQCMMRRTFPDQVHDMSLEYLPAGMYVITLQAGGHWVAKRMIKSY